MSGFSVIFYKGGILVCDSNPIIQRALDRLAVSVISGEASVAIVNVAKNSTPEIRPLSIIMG
jgi:hypothetical protein